MDMGESGRTLVPFNPLKMRIFIYLKERLQLEIHLHIQQKQHICLLLNGFLLKINNILYLNPKYY